MTMLVFFYLLLLSYICYNDNKQRTLNVISSWKQEYFYSQYWTNFVIKIYVSILVPYFLLIAYGVFKRYRQHPILVLIKYNNVQYSRNTNLILRTTMINVLLNSNGSVTTLYNVVISHIQCQLLFTCWILVSTTET